MKRIDQLLEKYFQAASSVEEEKELKRYFLSGNVDDEHKMYEPLFSAFSEEKRVKLPVAKQRKKTYSVFPTAFSMTGIAASIIFAMVWFLSPEKMSDTYIVMKGKKMDDQMLAQQYAEAKLAKAFALLDSGMEPIKRIENIEKNLEPLYKAKNTIETISDYETRISELIEGKTELSEK